MIDQIKNNIQDKNLDTNKDNIKSPSQRSLSLKDTKLRRQHMAIKVLSFNIQSNKLSKAKKSYLKLLSLETKWFYNYLVYLSQITVINDYGDLIYPHNLFQFNTKSNHIKVYNPIEKLYNDYELTVLSSQMKQEILKRIQSSIKSLIEKQKKNKLKGNSKGKNNTNTKLGRLKFKSFVNIPLKQFNNSFYLSDNCKKISLQGNKKVNFHLIRNKNLTKFSKQLNIYSGLNNKGLNNVSLKKLIDLKHIEIANAEIQYNPNKEQYIFNLTIYFNKESLKQVNLFQGTKLNIEDKELVNNLTVGNDSGIASEFTTNVGDSLQSVSMDSYIDPKKAKGLKKYQKRMNRHISQSKKQNKPTYKTKKYHKLKSRFNRIQNNINNHKKDTVNKLVSLMDNFKQVSFQKELIHTWHKNKTFHYSKIVQNGIRGKVYAKWQYKYNQQEEFNKTLTNNLNKELSKDNLQVKYKQIESKEKTTKNCICGKTNDIKLKDRMYTCSCGYKNDRDTHSSYYINHFDEFHQKHLNKNISSHVVIGSGIESMDKNYENNIYSNLEKIITSSDIEQNKIQSSNTEKFYLICKAKLKSQNLTITLNKFNLNSNLSNKLNNHLESVDKHTQEA